LTATRIKSLSVRGFRAYGAAEQTLNVSTDIAVVWGANSKGKTSLAEAFEFLLTGRTARRELMASSQDEFADALKNAHLAPDKEVYVAARITAPDGRSHQSRRVLTSDYAKRQDCASRLEIDGTAAPEADLASLGIVVVLT
jgi:recombinational DNA repair ATPase RecF